MRGLNPFKRFFRRLVAIGHPHVVRERFDSPLAIAAERQAVRRRCARGVVLRRASTIGEASCRCVRQPAPSLMHPQGVGRYRTSRLHPAPLSRCRAADDGIHCRRRQSHSRPSDARSRSRWLRRSTCARVCSWKSCPSSSTAILGIGRPCPRRNRDRYLPR
jgi:hypothetical protein